MVGKKLKLKDHTGEYEGVIVSHNHLGIVPYFDFLVCVTKGNKSKCFFKTHFNEKIQGVCRYFKKEHVIEEVKSSCKKNVAKIIVTKDINVGDIICLKSNFDVDFMLFFQANKIDVRDMQGEEFVKIIKN